ncbi:Na+/H+ antiporter NhaA [Chloracidobacterium sp. MS 40/45]|uniref:Na+/H+ antiporter NhaA n=1 Tax=Chloracidobacterium aggregatum TaxID=2851959 RepID=UPI001B8B41FD|nr:Na+/H+ antiporter NhaA [Chloracidobacterium aggregatum]QUV99735.1 Na+/H+ antiporter NhaA [Chloracidobacterium sp. MS 40/45]
MPIIEIRLSPTFKRFLLSEQASGVLLLVCTVVSLILANSPLGYAYLHAWHVKVAGLPVEVWVNDGLMAVFFLFIGLELKRELYVGELSNLRHALLPIVAALGGIVVPAAIHFTLNNGTVTQPGIGIPMATDIAFALGVLALLGNHVPGSLKVFLAALAVIDDLGAIVVIALFYSGALAWSYLGATLAILVVLLMFNRWGIRALWPYLLGGIAMWFCMFQSGVHATIAGVLLAFAIPFTEKSEDETSPSHRLERWLQRPVAFGIMPLFALANTGIVIEQGVLSLISSPNGVGIFVGLFIGKPVGIVLASIAAVLLGICRMPLDLNWKHLLGAGLLGGIGFTMSIFITNLAFPDNALIVSASKMTILLASLTAGTVGFLWLKFFGQPDVADRDLETMDYVTTSP